MPKKAAANSYRKLDAETIKEIASCVLEIHRETEKKAARFMHDRRRANIKLLLRKYRDIVSFVNDAIYDAAQLDYDMQLNDILELMSSNRREMVRVESIKESVATARVIVDHMNKMLETYKASCEACGIEDQRRYRVIMAMYIDKEKKTVEEIEKAESITRSSVYRDIDAAADRLAILFFGLYGLQFL